VRALAVPLLFLSLLTPPALCQQRIASLNLCTDLLLLELVAPERIVSLSYWAADPNMSYLADRVQDIPLNHSLAEEIVPLSPDLVLAGQFSDVQVVSLLRQLGLRVEVLDVPLTLAGLRPHLEAFGALVGEAEKATALADRIEQQLALVAAQSTRSAMPRPLAVVYGPQGVSPGRDTLMDDLLALTGYRNLAAEQGIASYGTLSLERLVMAEPDLLVIDDLVANRNSLAQQALDHPALRGRFSDQQVLTLPANLTACVGPTVVEAAQQLSRARGPAGAVQ
jgi:iron complex transport system substrate-binding protein